MRHALLSSTALVAAGLELAVLAAPVAAQDATWLASPGSGDFNTGANWSGGSVPTGTAFFNTSSQTSPSFSADTTIGGWTFNAGASNYSFANDQTLSFTGAGIVINGGSATIFTSHIGNLIFSGASTAGGATINNDGVVAFNNSSTADHAAIATHFIADFNDNSTAGSATIVNSGSVTFFNTSTAGSATITNNSALQFAGTSTAGNATITNNNFGTVSFFNASTAGNATITNDNGATVNFFNASAAGHATITNNNGGTLNFNDTSAAGSAAVSNDGNTNFLNGASAGSATIFTSHIGNLIFSGASTAGGATINNDGVVAFNNSSTADHAAIATHFIADFNDNSTAGSATIVNSGSVTFFNTSTAGSATITNNSALQFAGTSTAGNATITNNNFGTVSFLNASTAGNAAINNAGLTQFLGTSSGGNARFIAQAGGTFDISGLASAGTTAGSIEGAGSYVLGGKSLTVGSNNLSTEVSGVISGVGGALIKTGTGELTLSGINTYTGPTTVNGGTLSVNGSIASSSLTTVNAGGTVGGTGTLPSTLIASGGTLAPGNSIGTITVIGNLTFNAGSTYAVEVSTNADRTNVTGTAALAGTVAASLQPGISIGKSYTILSAAGGRGGTFNGVTTNMPGFTAELDYTITDVLLKLTASLGASQTLTINQQNVANSLNNYFNSGGALPPGFVKLFGLTGGNLPDALNQLSGEVATGAQQGAFQLGGQFLGIMLDPFVDGRGGVGGASGGAPGFASERLTWPDVALAYAKAAPFLPSPASGQGKAPAYKAPSFAQGWSLWGAAYGGSNRTDGEANTVGSHDLSARAAGFAAGMDYRVTPATTLGFALAGGGTNWSLAQGLGSGNSDAFQAGVYGATHTGPLYLGASLAFTNYRMSTDRYAAFGDHLTADFNARSIGARIESGWRLSTPAMGVTPYAALQAQGFRTPSYSETDLSGGGFALSYDSRTATDTRSELGARFDHVVAVAPTAALTLRGRLAWAHDWVSDPTLTAAFQALPGASFIVNGAEPVTDSALVSAGAELRLANGVALLAKFDGEFASRARTYAATATMRYTW